MAMIHRGADAGTERAAVGEGYLPLDIYRTDKGWVIRAAVPGADPQTVEATCDRNTITIKGDIRWPEGTKSEDFWLRENYYGKLWRQITLPEDALCEQTKAEFRNGMLMLVVPRAQPSKPRVTKIPVAASGSGAGQRGVERAAAARQVRRT